MSASYGWDGPGLGTSELQYYVGVVPSSFSLSQNDVESAIDQALREWSEVADLKFTETSRPGQLDTLDFSFRSIDGAGGTLAQAYFPDDVNPARIAGDVQFDVADNFEIGNAQGSRAFDFLQVAVHEIGHALGLDHSDHHDSVLAPTVSPHQQFTALHSADVESIQSLYAPAVRIESGRPDSETELPSVEPVLIVVPDPPSDDVGQADDPAADVDPSPDDGGSNLGDDHDDEDDPMEIDPENDDRGNRWSWWRIVIPHRPGRFGFSPSGWGSFFGFRWFIWFR